MRLAPLLLVLALTGCSSFYSSSREEKLAAFSAHRTSWSEDISPKEFGLSRSVQIIRGDKVRIGRNRLAYEGGLGMASLITTDGYALTAAHVITNPPLDAFLALPLTSGRPGPTVHVHRQGPGAGDEEGKPRASNRLIAYSPRLREPVALPIHTTEVRTLRIVKSFPERDVALVKLPMKTHVAFELCRKPLAKDMPLFSSGNWATPYRGTSAGTVTSLDTNHPSATIIRTTAPLAKGDSGGPVFDAEGHLVGIASRVIPSQILPYPKLRHSSLRTIDPATIEQLIREDRKAQR